ncbi:MAG: response regulator [Cyanobacteria bacterium FC1]|nr:response regulator [Cyanobacteria bacterium FC1]
MAGRLDALRVKLMDDWSVGRMTAKKILLVEDDTNVREVVQLCLQDLGNWIVLATSSPVQGLQHAQQEEPDAIVLDISMPGMDGFMFLEELRSNPKTQNIPVVLLSAKARWLNSHLLERYQVAGAIAKCSELQTSRDKTANRQ